MIDQLKRRPPEPCPDRRREIRAVQDARSKPSLRLAKSVVDRMRFE
jgi:hypothetical protein